MAAPLLETKLRIPRLRRSLVARPRLSERLNRAAEAALTLVSAPAGFGKTTLLAEWLAAAPPDGPSVAWLSLDRRDNDPVTFWSYVVAALQIAAPGVGVGARSVLESAQPSTEAVTATLLNDLDAITSTVVLVLDDYHVIDAYDIQDGMALLLEHPPPPLHLVLAGRADPPLPLARLRARGELVEIRAADLRFTPDEAAAYLNQVMGLALTARDVAALEGRTEGWIAALQLAALSMQGREDTAAFIAGFAGDDRYIVDYLVEEVLARQPEQVRQFLLRTSILDRLSGSLCDAVTGHDGGKADLVALERGNLFVVPLDDRRQWYRYHRLFGDVLQAHLIDEQPSAVSGLHGRASAWYEHNGEPSEAIRHALAARDFARAAHLVELAVPAMRTSRQEAVLLGWLRLLPEDLVRVRPVLSAGLAGALLACGALDDVEAPLRDAERWLEATDAQHGSLPAEIVFSDEKELRRVPSAAALYRAALALARGDLAGTVGHARRAIDRAPEEDHLVRASAAGLAGLASWTCGGLDAGHRSFTECVEGLHRAGHLADTFGCAIALADMRRTQGHLGDAMRTYEQALQFASDQGGAVLRGTADMYVGMAELACEHDDVSTAMRHLLASQQLGDHTGLPQNRYRWRVAMARIREAEGDYDGALDLLDEAERLYVGDFFPNVRPVPALRARVWATHGRLGEALAWVRERGLSVGDDLSYLCEFEHIILARVLLARYTTERNEVALGDASRLLERLLGAAEEGARGGSVIEILVLQVLALQTTGDIPAALTSLQRALTMAEPEGYARVFLDEGAPMASLLRSASKQQPGSDYVRRLLASATKTEHRPPIKHGLVEALSDRELDVLRLLRSDLDGPDIARELMVSLNTMRTHTTHIYTKLGVGSRRAAVRRAEELHLL